MVTQCSQSSKGIQRFVISLVRTFGCMRAMAAIQLIGGRPFLRILTKFFITVILM